MPLSPKRPWIIGHRGVPGEAPENTLSGFELAIRQGADLIELDLHMTADKQLVVIHDDRVDRTTNGTGRVAELSLNELRALDAGSWMDPQFAGERIPTLPEVFDLSADRAGVVVDLKQGSARYEGIDQLLARVIESAQRLVDVIVISRDSEAIESIHRINPDIMTLDFGHPPIASPEWLEGKALSRPGKRFVFASGSEIDKGRIARIRDLGYGVLCSLIYEELTLHSLEGILASSVDGIFTDHVREVKRALRR